jgi:peptidoglycan/LPS O-acetylase OafA/YrhL
LPTAAAAEEDALNAPPAAHTGSRTLPYAPGLDGVRGLAVLAVLLFHGGITWAGTGWLGVDAFFVLSGFLITALLVREHAASGRVALGPFWLRRARRLLPALLVVVTASLAFAALTAPEGVTPGLRNSAFATFGYVQNWHLLLADDGGYFAQGGPPSPLRHAWSLSVEEQFYVVWPLVTAAALAAFRSRALLVVCSLGTLASASWAALLAARGVPLDRLHLGTDTRAQGLLVGATAAVLLARHPDARWVRWVGLPGLVAAVSVPVVLLAAPTLAAYSGALTVFCVAVAAVLVAVVRCPESPVGRLLSWSPLVWLGQLSYGLYLWHWPVFLALTGARTGLTGWPLLALRIAVSLVLTVLTARLVEQPFRSGPWSTPRRVVAVLPAAVAGVAAAAAVAVVLAPPAPDAPPLDAAALAAVQPPPPSTAPTPSPAPPPAGTPVTSTAPAHHGGPLRVLVVGDSVAMTLAAALPSSSDVTVLNGGVLGCGLLESGRYRYAGDVAATPSKCVGTPQRWAQAARDHQADVVAVLVGRWEVMDREVDGRWTQLGDPEYEHDVRGRLDDALRTVAATGARPVLLTAPYSRRVERPDGGLWPEDTADRVDRWNSLVREVAAAQQWAVIDLNRRTGPQGRYTNEVEGVRLRYDGLHITRSAGRWLAPWLLPELARAAT